LLSSPLTYPDKIRGYCLFSGKTILVMGSAFTSSRFIKWPPSGISPIKEQACVFELDLSMPYGYAISDHYEFIVGFEWRLALFSKTSLKQVFAATYKTNYLIDGECDESQIMELAKESYGKLTIAWRNQLKVEDITEPEILEFNEERAAKIIELLCERMRLE
jgi:hypothetical protein